MISSPKLNYRSNGFQNHISSSDSHTLREGAGSRTHTHTRASHCERRKFCQLIARLPELFLSFLSSDVLLRADKYLIWFQWIRFHSQYADARWRAHNKYPIGFMCANRIL